MFRISYEKLRGEPYTVKLTKKIGESNSTDEILKLFKEMEQHERFIEDKIQYHQEIIKQSTQFSQGYLRTMKVLNNGEFGLDNISYSKKKTYVDNVFMMIKIDRDSEYLKGAMVAINDYKKWNRKNGLTIYNRPI